MANAIDLSVPLDEVQAAVRERVLAGAASHDEVVWSRDGAELLVHARSLRLRATAGFLVAELAAESEQTGAVSVRMVLFLGTAAAGGGLSAAVSHDGATPAVLVDAWGEALRAAVWEGVLDVVEGVAVTASRVAGVPLRVLGLTGGEDRVHIAVGA